MTSKWTPNEPQMDPKWYKMKPEMKIRRQLEAHIHNKTEPYIMKAIMQETRKVFNKAAGFREAYWISYIIKMMQA